MFDQAWQTEPNSPVFQVNRLLVPGLCVWHASLVKPRSESLCLVPDIGKSLIPGRGAGPSGRRVTKTRPPSAALATKPNPTTGPAGPGTRPKLPRHQAPVYGTPGPTIRAPRPAWAWVLRGNKPGRPGPWVWALGPGPARALGGAPVIGCQD